VRSIYFHQKPQDIPGGTAGPSGSLLRRSILGAIQDTFSFKTNKVVTRNPAMKISVIIRTSVGISMADRIEAFECSDKFVSHKTRFGHTGQDHVEVRIQLPTNCRDVLLEHMGICFI